MYISNNRFCKYTVIDTMIFQKIIIFVIYNIYRICQIFDVITKLINNHPIEKIKNSKKNFFSSTFIILKTIYCFFYNIFQQNYSFILAFVTNNFINLLKNIRNKPYYRINKIKLKRRGFLLALGIMTCCVSEKTIEEDIDLNYSFRDTVTNNSDQVLKTGFFNSGSSVTANLACQIKHLQHKYGAKLSDVSDYEEVELGRTRSLLHTIHENEFDLNGQKYWLDNSKVKKNFSKNPSNYYDQPETIIKPTHKLTYHTHYKIISINIPHYKFRNNNTDVLKMLVTLNPEIDIFCINELYLKSSVIVPNGYNFFTSQNGKIKTTGIIVKECLLNKVDQLESVLNETTLKISNGPKNSDFFHLTSIYRSPSDKTKTRFFDDLDFCSKDSNKVFAENFIELLTSENLQNQILCGDINWSTSKKYSNNRFFENKF